jgi:heat shock protein HtpX
MLNVYERVDQNKRRSVLIMVGFVIFVVGFVYIIGQIFGSGRGVIIGALVFSILSSVGSYFWGDKLVIKLTGAKPANKNDFFDYYTAVENLCLAAQVPMPDLYVIQSPAMNAFASGRNPEHAVICITTGLLNNLDRTELEGVIAHEISHIINYDIRLMMIVAVLVGTITIISEWLIRLGRLGSSRDSKKSNPIGLAGGLIALIISPIAAKLIQLSLSRRREYLADATAVKLTRQPSGLINALQKLNQNQIPMKTAHQATAHLFIINPFKNTGGLKKLFSLFSTHPPIEERIKNLQKMS